MIFFAWNYLPFDNPFISLVQQFSFLLDIDFLSVTTEVYCGKAFYFDFHEWWYQKIG